MKEIGCIENDFDIWKMKILNHKIDGGSTCGTLIKELTKYNEKIHLVTEKEGCFSEMNFSCGKFKTDSLKKIKDFFEKVNISNCNIFLFNIYSNIFYDSNMNEYRDYFLVFDTDLELDFNEFISC